MKEKYKIASLFSGCGGLDLGFINAGFEVVWANDFFKEAVQTYKENIGNHIVYGDITKIISSDIPNNFDILLGGFPCQGFSVANIKRSMQDERNFLYKELLRLIEDKQPKFFVAENVKGLLSMKRGKIIEMIINDFRALGYDVDYKLLKASDYGVPQNRERVVIIGNRLGLKNPFPKITHGINKNLKPYVKVKDVVGYLADVRTRNNPFVHNGKMIYNHIARINVSDKFWGRKHKIDQHEICDYLKYWKSKTNWSSKKIDEHFGYAHTAGHWFRKDNNSGSIPNPKDWWELKKILKFDDKYDKAVTELELKEIKFEQSLRINNWDLPSDTITATGHEIHPNKERRMSVRECAIIQTFPDDFVFYGSLGNMYKQIGNPVPVLLAEKIAESIKIELDKYEQIDRRTIRKLELIEVLEQKYLNKYFYFLKFAEDELLRGFKTKEKIKNDWIGLYDSRISDFSVGAERIVYALLNGKGIGQPNSCPVGSDLFFEVYDAFIHIDLKTVGASLTGSTNIGDFISDIFVGENQNSYKGNIIVNGVSREYNPALSTKYNANTKDEKLCLSYFVTILYDKDTLDTLVMCIMCMPNGELEPHYTTRVLAAGKNPFKARFRFSNIPSFELLEKEPKRIKVVYFNKNMDNTYKERLSFFEDLYDNK